MTVFNLSQLNSACNGFIEALKRDINVALIETSDSIKKDIKADTSFGGEKLRNSFNTIKTGAYKFKIMSKSPHGVFIEEGTRPHVIRPRFKKCLRFVSRSGDIVFAKKVNHPGNKAYRFFSRALTKANGTFKRKLQTALRHAAQRWR